MRNRYRRNSRRGMRNLGSAGMAGLNYTVEAIDRSATGLFRWATTDHSGTAQRLLAMPKMGFIDSIRYILFSLFLGLVYSVVMGVSTFLLIAYGIPLLLGIAF